MARIVRHALALVLVLAGVLSVAQRVPATAASSFPTSATAPRQATERSTLKPSTLGKVSQQHPGNAQIQLTPTPRLSPAIAPALYPACDGSGSSVMLFVGDTLSLNFFAPASDPIVSFYSTGNYDSTFLRTISITAGNIPNITNFSPFFDNGTNTHFEVSGDVNPPTAASTSAYTLTTVTFQAVAQTAGTQLVVPKYQINYTTHSSICEATNTIIIQPASQPVLGLEVTAPNTIPVVNGQYQPIDVVIAVRNIGTATVHNVELRLQIPDDLGAGNIAEFIGDFAPGQEQQRTWSVYVAPGAPTTGETLTYLVTVQGSDTQPITVERQITIPAAQEVHNLSFQADIYGDSAPETIEYPSDLVFYDYGGFGYNAHIYGANLAPGDQIAYAISGDDPAAFAFNITPSSGVPVTLTVTPAQYSAATVTMPSPSQLHFVWDVEESGVHLKLHRFAELLSNPQITAKNVISETFSIENIGSLFTMNTFSEYVHTDDVAGTRDFDNNGKNETLLAVNDFSTTGYPVFGKVYLDNQNIGIELRNANHFATVNHAVNQEISVGASLTIGTAAYISSIAQDPTTAEQQVKNDALLLLGTCTVTVSKDVRVTTDCQPQNEPTIAYDPNNSNILVAGANDFREKNSAGLFVPRCGWYFSRQGGAAGSWTQNVFVPPVTVDPQVDAGADPSVGIDGSHNVYYSCLVFNNNGRISTDKTEFFTAVVVYKGQLVNNTLSWDSTPMQVVADSAQVADQHQTIFNGKAHDKPYLAVDKNSGKVYVSWTRSCRGDLLDPINCSSLTVTKQIFIAGLAQDGTFSNPKPTMVSDNDLFHDKQDHGSVPVIASNGTIYVAWVDQSSHRILIDRSTDGGANWGTDYDVSMKTNTGTTDAFPALGVDPTNPNVVDVAWPVGTDILFARCTFASSTLTCTPGHKVNDEPAGEDTEQSFPWMSVAPDGRIAIVYYSRTDARTDTQQTKTLNMDVYVATSTDKGDNFTKVKVTDVPTNQYNGQVGNSPLFYGDYIGISVDNIGAYPIWTAGYKDASGNNNQDTYTTTIYFGQFRTALPLILK